MLCLASSLVPYFLFRDRSEDSSHCGEDRCHSFGVKSEYKIGRTSDLRGFLWNTYSTLDLG